MRTNRANEIMADMKSLSKDKYIYCGNQRDQKGRCHEMNNVVKGMILVLMILYIISPLDACPGPIDDLLVLIIGLASRKRIGTKEDERRGWI